MDISINIIDDDASMLQALKSSISELGHRVATYSSAQSFLNRTPAKIPCVLLLDMQMPGMSGLEVQSILNSLADPIVIVFISGQSHPQQIIQSMKAGAFDFLIKPFSLDQLEDALKKAVKKAEDLHSQNQTDIYVKSRYSTLTARERQVFSALGRGSLVKTIANDFGVSISVIKLHKARVMKKLSLKNLQDLTRIFEQLGKPIIPPENSKRSI